MSMRGLLVAAAVVSGLASAGAVVAAGLPPVEYVTARIPAAVQPVSPQAALARVLAGGGLDAVITASLGPPATGASSPGPSLVTIVRGGSSVGDGSDDLGRWEADLLAGAVSDLSGSGPSITDNLSGASVSERLANGSVVTGVPCAGGFGNVASRQEFADDPPDLIRANVQAVANRYGLVVESVQVMHALTAAPAVVVRAPDTSVLARSADVATAMFGLPPRYEGYSLEWDDGDGTPVLRQTASFRTGAGGTWAQPGYAGPLGVIHGGVATPPLAASCPTFRGRIAGLTNRLRRLVETRSQIASKAGRRPLTLAINGIAHQRRDLIGIVSKSACAMNRSTATPL
jgi:hypothetical protein